MREIKYRGQRIDTKEWVYGCVIRNSLGWYFIIESNNINKFIRVIPETVAQYTGLKDKNGVEIYENSIIKFGNQIGFIGEMQHGCYTFVRKEEYFKCDPLPMFHMSLKYVEVIGNIYENPELVTEVIREEI